MADTVTPEERSDEQLVTAFQAGEEPAFAVLVDRYKARLLRLAQSVLHDEEEAKDVLQDALIKVYHALGKFRGASSVYTWLYRIVMNQAIDHVRRRPEHAPEALDAHEYHLADASSATRPDKEMLRNELHQHIFAAVDELPVKHRETVLLREVEGLSYKEIAGVMKCSEGTVMSRLFYARERLREKLTPYLKGTI